MTGRLVGSGGGGGRFGRLVGITGRPVGGRTGRAVKTGPGTGMRVGWRVGLLVGRGVKTGPGTGILVGERVGLFVGLATGLSVGLSTGLSVGSAGEPQTST